MSGWGSSRPPWETQGQPALPPENEDWYGRTHGPRVVIKSHGHPAHGAGGPDRMPRRVVLAWLSAGVVIAVAITWGVLRLTHVIGGAPAAGPTSSAPALSPTVTSAPAAPTATATTSPTTSATGGTAYALTTPGTAGGYTLTTPMSASIKEANSNAATALMQGGAAAGGTKGSEVTGEYLIPGNQQLGYSGYTGTFNPQTVINAFEMMTTGVTSEPAGAHGGLLSCGTLTITSPAASTGTACVWATPTTVGLVEFFGGDALEQVTMTRAGQDTAKFRADVEAAKQ